MKSRVSRAVYCVLAVCLFASALLCSFGCSGKKAEFDAEAAFEHLLNDVKYAAPLTDESSMASILFGELPEGTQVRMYTADGTNEDALMMFTVADENDVNTIRSSVKDYIDMRLYEAERYAPEQVQKLRDAQTFVDGNTIIVCITDDTEAVRSILSN